MTKTLVSLILSAAVLVIATKPSQATVFFNETFDDGQAAIQSRWAQSCAPFLSSGVFSLDSSQKVSGGYSLKEVVNGLTTRTPEYLSGTCFIDRSIPNSQTLYTRWYERTQSGFIYDPSNVKTANVGPCCAYPSWWFGHFNGSTDIIGAGQNVNEGGGAVYYTQNKSSANTKTNTWECVETQITMNTPGVANGILRIWVDGALRGEWLNRNFRPAGSNDAFTLFRLYAQHGVGTRWFDDIAAADTRIGCSGTASNPTPTAGTPPAAPNGLIVQ